MDEDTFWKLIERPDWRWADEDEERVLEPLVEALVALGEDAAVSFEESLAEKLHRLDTREHARRIGEGSYIDDDEPFPVDGFLYASCLAVARGREACKAALADPDRMPRDEEFEALLYAASEANERLTGREFDYDAALSYETFSNRAGWA